MIQMEPSYRMSVVLMAFAFANTLLVSLFLGAGFIAQGLAIVENPADASNSFSLLAYVIATAAVLLLVLHFYKGRSLFFYFELSLVFSSFLILLSTFLPGEYAYAAAGAAVLLRVLAPKLKGIFMFAAAAIVGALLGSSLDILPAALFAVFLSAYDYIAVFKTRHMIELAKSLSKRGASFSVSTGQDGSRVELGLGDFVMGGMICVSALKIGAFPGFGYGLAAVFGALFGLSAMFLYLEKRKGYFPAVPPIALGSLGFVAIYWAVLNFALIVA